MKCPFMRLRGFAAFSSRSLTTGDRPTCQCQSSFTMINRADEAFLIGGWCLSSLWGTYRQYYYLASSLIVDRRSLKPAGIFTALVFYCVRQVVERKKTYLSRSIFLTTVAVVVLCVRFQVLPSQSFSRNSNLTHQLLTWFVRLQVGAEHCLYWVSLR